MLRSLLPGASAQKNGEQLSEPMRSRALVCMGTIRLRPTRWAKVSAGSVVAHSPPADLLSRLRRHGGAERLPDASAGAFAVHDFCLSSALATTDNDWVSACSMG
jgi:hypothetical protein